MVRESSPRGLRERGGGGGACAARLFRGGMLSCCLRARGRNYLSLEWYIFLFAHRTCVTHRGLFILPSLLSLFFFRIRVDSDGRHVVLDFYRAKPDDEAVRRFFLIILTPLGCPPPPPSLPPPISPPPPNLCLSAVPTRFLHQIIQCITQVFLHSILPHILKNTPSAYFLECRGLEHPGMHMVTGIMVITATATRLMSSTMK